MKIIKKLTATLFFTSLIFSQATFANESKKSIEQMEYDLIKSVIPKTKIGKYQKSAIQGFYSVFLENGQIIYINPTERLILFGEIWNERGESYTANKRQKWQMELEKKNTSASIENTSVEELTKYSKKITFGKGDNKYQFVIFTDIVCKFCKDVETLFFSKKNVDLYLNFAPQEFQNEHEYSIKATEIALSSKNFEKVYKAAQDRTLDTTDKKTSKEAKEQLKNMIALSKKHQVVGTPKIYVINKKEKKVVDVILGANYKKLNKYIVPSK